MATISVQTLLQSALPAGPSGLSGYSGYSGSIGISGTSGVLGSSGTSGTSGVAGSTTTLNATNDTATTALYPVMVAAAGSVQTVKATTSKLVFNANTGQLDATIFNSTSDESLKTNIQKIENACDIISKLDGVSFQWKENNIKSYGFIAQNVQKVIPEIVTETRGLKTLNYDAIIAFLVEANKDLEKRIQRLEQNSKGEN